MSASGTLHSDHVNYLVFRYLQECGHEESARAFYRDWHRPREFRDPEDLPFAPVVHRHELISVIQDGLRHDEIQTRVTRGQRRFRWTQVNARQGVDGENEFEQGPDGVRPSSSGKRKGAGVRAPHDFSAPAPKRQRVNHVPDAVHINGDREAMDVDEQSPSAVDGEDDGDAVSPTVTSEGAVDIPAERYDSVATQTEVKVGPKTTTLGFTIDKPGAKILHSSWNTSRAAKDKCTLMTVGESLCRLYKTPENLDGNISTIEHVDEPGLTADSVVTAMAWHPEGRLATCAVDSFRQLPSGKEIATPMVMDIGPDIVGTVVLPSGPKLLDPAGVVLCVRYSPSGEHVLVARMNMSRGLVQIWATEFAEIDLPKRSPPVAWRIFEHSIMDAVWTNDNSLVVCGDKGIASYLQLTGTRDTPTDFTADTIAVHNLIDQHIDLPLPGTRWMKVRHDELHKLDLFFSADANRLVVSDQRQYASQDTANNTLQIDLPHGLTAMALRPVQGRQSASNGTTLDTKALLATVYDNGACDLHVLDREDDRPVCTALYKPTQATFELSEGPALALAWSPDGVYLAVAGIDLVQVWHVQVSSTKSLDSRPLVTWRPNSDTFGGVRNGEHEMGGEVLVEPSLSWNVDGERLSFAVDNKVAIITFRPPLHSEEVVVVVANGV